MELKVTKVENPIFKDLELIPSDCGRMFVNKRLLKEMEEQKKKEEDQAYIDRILSLPDIDLDWL